MAEPIAQLTGVTRAYAGSARPALDKVSLVIPRGRVTAIMGPSGSGKSTLLNIIAGLDRPTAGQVVVDGVELTGMSESALARHRRSTVGMIFQFFNLLNNLSALDNIVVAAQLQGASVGHARAAAMDLLDRLGIASQSARYPAQLSGGERQRVAIARALINQPPLLLADEPTGALDTRTGEEVLEVLADLSRAGQSIVLVTHDPRLAAAVAHDVVQIVDGALLPATRAAGLGVA